MRIRQFAKALQLRHKLQHDVLMNVVRFSALHFLLRVEAEFKTNDALDHGLGMVCDELGKQFVGVLIGGRGQERLEQRIDLDRELLHIVRRLSVI